MIATIWEVWNDRHGDLNKSQDVVIRAILLIIEAATLRLFTHKPFFTCLLLSSAVFFMFFDYLITYALIRNKVIEPRIGGGYSWFTVTGKKGWFDNLKPWKFASPWVRFGIKLAYLIVSLVLFFTL